MICMIIDSLEAHQVLKKYTVRKKQAPKPQMPQFIPPIQGKFFEFVAVATGYDSTSSYSCEWVISV